MEPEVKSIIANNSVKGVMHTHVSLFEPKDCYSIGRDKSEEFWEAYCETLSKKKKKFTCGLAEKAMSDFLPVLSDVDLRMKDCDKMQQFPDKLYTDKELKDVIGIYQSVLREIVTECTETDLICVLLEKKMYQENKNDSIIYKNGFHLHFPYVFLSKIEQEVHLIPRVQALMKNLKIFEYLDIEDSSTVIDTCVTKNHWLLYGSKKSENAEPYKVTKIFDSKLNEIPIEKAFKKYKIFDRDEEVIDIPNSSVAKELSKKYEYYLPRILSIIIAGRPARHVKQNLVSPIKEKIKKERKALPKHTPEALSHDESIRICRKLVPMLSAARAHGRLDWMYVGWCLYNITDGSQDGLDLWCEFSSKSEKYDEAVCIHEWDKMTKKNLNMGTLRHMAGIDSPKEYIAFKSEETERLISGNNNLETEITESDVANVLFQEYSDEFICGSYTNETWYQFTGIYWKPIEKGIFLRKKIGTDLRIKYNLAITKIYAQINNNLMEEKNELNTSLQAKVLKLQKVSKKLGTTAFKNGVMKECLEQFYSENFEDNLDKDPYIIGFKNGVFDLKNHVFRAGRPDDYLSRTLPMNYTVFSETDDRLLNLLKFFEQILPDKDIRNYFLDISAEIFVGKNVDKIFQIWSATGDNGKSVTQLLFESMLGTLAIKMNTTVITGKKPASGAADAERARMGNGVRMVVIEEPNDDEEINSGIVKTMTGSDSQTARDLFQKGKDVKQIMPMFKFIFICNKLPRIRGSDPAFWNRARVIPFESKFVKPSMAPATYEEQLRAKRFPMDKNFGEKIPNLIEPLAWFLLERRKNGLKKIEPAKVLEATEEYRRENDVYRQFMEESVTIDPTGDNVMSLTLLYEMFKNWYKSSIPGRTLPVKADLEGYLITVLGHPEKGKKWKGIKQKTNEDEDDEKKEEEEVVKIKLEGH